jgi:ketosteroid isomerase-like protein
MNLPGSRAARTGSLVVLTLVAQACEPPREPEGTGSSPQPAPPAAVPATPGASAGDEVALRELSDRWVRGLRSGDADTVASVYSVKAEVFLPDAPDLLLGQAAVRERLSSWLNENRVVELEVRRSAFVVRPELAYSLGIWHAVTAPQAGGPADSISGRISDVYRREPGQPWVVVHEHVSRALPSDSLAAPF